MTHHHFDLSEIYPAPPLSGDGVVTAEFLERIIRSKTKGDNLASAYFARGNQHLRGDDPKLAVKAYQAALKLEPQWAVVRSNLSLALYALGKFKEAGREAKRATLREPGLVTALLIAARVAIRDDNTDDAIENLERIIAIHPGHVEALKSLGRVHEGLRNTEKACLYYEQLLVRYPDDLQAQNTLALFDFRRGKRWFRQGKLAEAFHVWGGSYRRFPRAFQTSKKIVNEMLLLVREYHDKGKFSDALDRYRTAYRSNPGDTSILYPFISQYLFSIGLYPEGYEELGELDAEFQRWRSSIEELGEHPYPHFRFALIYLYRGDWDNAFLELSVCQDRFPPKKQGALKIKDLIALVKLMREIESRKDEFLNVKRSTDEWVEAGFDTPFRARPWRKSGLAPAVAFQWMEAGFNPKQAVQWSRERIDPEIAAHWLAKGFKDAVEVRIWLRSNFTPEEAVRWKEGCPLEFDKIVQFRGAGFDDPALAYRWSIHFLFPLEAHQWHELGYSPEEAAAWREHGFLEAVKAERWRAQGYDPKSALRDYNAVGV